MSPRNLSFLIFITLWEVGGRLIASELFPSISEIVSSLFFHIEHSHLLRDLFATLYRVFIAFFLTMFVGIIIGLCMGFFPIVDKSLDLLLTFFLNIPALITIIISYIWFGLSDFAAITAVIINKVPIVIVNIREGTKAFEKKYTQFASIYKLPKRDIVSNIYLPQLYPYLLATTRLTLSLIWKIVLVVELLGRSDGIGFQISIYFQLFDITSILAYSLGFIIVVLGIEYLILQPIERRVNRWR